MTGATHIVTAAAIYRYGRFNRFYMLLLVFFSHFLLDAVPHYELNLAWNYILGVCAVVFIIYESRVLEDHWIMAAGLLGGLADLNWLLGLSSLLSYIHKLIHFKSFIHPGITFLLMEVIFLVACLYYLQKDPKIKNPELEQHTRL